MKIKKISAVGGLLVAVLAISSFTTVQPTQQDEHKPVNLKVLPKNISPEDLENTMKGFSAALGVKCGFCHAPKANGEEGLDFASDENHHKEVARGMLKMTNKINKKYFKRLDKEGMLKQIGCATCHNGQIHPEIRHVAVK